MSKMAQKRYRIPQSEHFYSGTATNKAKIGSKLVKTVRQVPVFALTGFFEILCFHFLS